MTPLSIDFFQQRRHAALNAVHTWLLVGGSVGLLAVCAWVLFGPTGIFYAIVFGVVSLLMASRVSPALVLRMYRAKAVSRAEFPTGHQIVEILAKRAGLIAPPKLYVVPSRMMNAFAVGRPADSAIAMTDRLIRGLTVRELTGVIAHEMAHIRNEDVKVMAIADMVSRLTSAMSTVGILSAFLNLPAILFGTAASVPWSAVLLLVAAPTIGGLLQMALSRAREYDADLGAVMLTGDPDGLASALTKLERIQGRRWEGMVLPTGRVPDPSILRSHPKTADRVARLMALKKPAEAQELPLQAPPRRPVRRRSLVPTIRGPRHADYASLLGDHPIEPVIDQAVADDPACERSLNPPANGPRVRISRGGVWW